MTPARSVDVATQPLTQFEQAVDQLEVCAPAPVVVQRLLGLLLDGRASWIEIENVLSVDGGLVTRVLRLASTPAFVARQVSSLRFAVQALGADQLRRLVVAAQFAGRGTLFGRSLWAYALRVACTADALARHLAHSSTADPFLCGLLHDVGTMALEHFLGRSYTTAGFTPGDDQQVAIERDAFGFDHTDLGAMIAARWRLFPELELVAQLHHDPFAAEARAVPDGTRAAIDAVALARLVGRPLDADGVALRDRLCRRHDMLVDTAEDCGRDGAAVAADLLTSLG